MEEAQRIFDQALGLHIHVQDLTIAQMAARAVVVYVIALAILRLGKKRLMGRATAFDVVLGIMLGAVISRAINGAAPFFPSLAAGAVLVLMHWLFSWAALHSSLAGRAIKGAPDLVVRDGETDRALMKKAHVTDEDLMEDLREKGVALIEDVREARVEPSGKLSVIKR